MVDAQSWRGADWSVGYERLLAWWRAKGHLDVPVDFVCDDSFRLGRWVNTQRVWRRSGRLQPDRERLLTDLGLVWDPAAVRQGRILAAARAYVAVHGHAVVPRNHTTPDGLPLGGWLRTQKRLVAQGKASDEVVSLLREVGLLDDDMTPDDASKLSALRDFVGREGHADVPRNHSYEGGVGLHQWLRDVVARKKRGALPLRLERELIGLGVTTFTWSRWSDEDVLATIRAAASFSFPLSQADYRRLTREGAIAGMDSNHIVARFGSWNAACDLAGVESVSRKVYSSDEVLTAVREFIDSEPPPHTTMTYTAWVRGVRGRPSMIVVQRFFGTWSTVLDEVRKDRR